VSSTTLRPAGAVEAQGLAAYLQRVLALDARAAVRLQGRGTVLGVWSGPPFDVLALRPVALAVPADLDVTVSGQRLLDAMGTALGDEFTVPTSVTGPGWAGLLPPRSGWTRIGQVTVESLHASVASGVTSFRAKAESVPEPERSQDRLDQWAREVWRTPVVGGIPLRAAHAADRLGLLGPDGDAVALQSGAWRRLALPGGSVALRDLDVPGLSLLFG
jgi:hypothetical protein